MVEQKEQKRCIAETALRGHYGGIVRRVLAITRQVREEQCKKQSSRFLHSCLPVCLPEKAFEYRQRRVLRRAVHFLHAGTWLQCTLPCTLCRVQRERWFLALRPCSGQGLFFFPCSRASLLHQKTSSYVLLLLLHTLKHLFLRYQFQ